MKKKDHFKSDHPKVVDWQTAIREIAASADGKLDRRVAFEAAQALLSYCVPGQEHAEDRPFNRLGKSTAQVAGIAKKHPAIWSFVETIREINLCSLGIHIVDPIAGRLSAIWTNVGDPTPDNLAKAELYARVWNRIYRQLFRPSATLINAIESGVLPWKCENVSLRTSSAKGGNSKNLFANSFFQESISCASVLNNIISESLLNFPRYGNHHDDDAAVQLSWNELKDKSFGLKMDRIASKFRNEVIDDPSIRALFRQYLIDCGDCSLPILEDESVSDVRNWDMILDVIQAIQSSFLSQPSFCDESGLWIHRSELEKSPSREVPSIYYIFGLIKDSQYLPNMQPYVELSFNALGAAISGLIESSFPRDLKPSLLTDEIYQKIQEHQTKINNNRGGSPRGKIEYYPSGVKQWLSVIEKLMVDAKHEGHSISYNIGYGSLAYAQSHLYLYEPAPCDLLQYIDQVKVNMIGCYVKGFYSIFGNRNDRGLWFNELGEYCGVFESADKRNFEATKLDAGLNSHHEDTILFAKIKGVGFVDILDQSANQIVRVKDGKVVNMGRGDEGREVAMKTLASHVVPEPFRAISELLVNQLVERLQTETHGTSFIISFDASALPSARTKREWCSEIEAQTKVLTQKFGRLDAPLATYEQLMDYVDEKKMPERHLKFMAELANLDGGLWLSISKNEGLKIKAAQQFIPLLKLGNGNIRPLDLQMNLDLLGLDVISQSALPTSALDPFESYGGLKSFFAAIRGSSEYQSAHSSKSGPIDRYVEALAFLRHSGTKTHSLWGMSMTAKEPCLCVVISSDGNVYIFHDGREFINLV